MKILADRSLPLSEALYQAPFELSYFDSIKDITDSLAEQDVLLCRSTLKVSNKLIKNTSLQCIATASSGIDHIDTQALIKQGIRLFHANGCNAASVSDYIVACLAHLSQQGLFTGKTAGIIGYGEVGRRVHARLLTLGLSVLIYDPLKASVDNHFQSCRLEDLYNCELLCLHANLHKTPPFPSHHLINEQVIKALKPGTIVINAARGELVDENALLTHGKHIEYCTDVYAKEPYLSKAIVDKALLCTPHIAGHSLDAKRNAVTMVASALHTYFKINMPQILSLSPIECPNIEQKSNWQESILLIYHPLKETLALKSAHNLDQTFLTLRHAHQKRRDFSAYLRQEPCDFWRALTGQ